MRSTLAIAMFTAGCGLTTPEPTPPARSAPATPTARTLTASAPTGTIAYVCEAATAATCVVKPDGSGQRQLDTGPGSAFPAPADPRGTDALVVRSEDGPEGHRETLLRAPLSGGALVVLAPGSERVRNPAWGPAGRFVVYESDAASYRDLYLVPRDAGAAPVRLTTSEQGNFEPDVSPDGRWVALGSSRDGQAEIYRIDIDGTHPLRLTDSPGDDMRPRWSPNGKQLAFLTRREGRMRAWVMGPDGSAPHPVRPEGTEEHADLHWSPDGRFLLLDVDDAGQQDLAVVDVAAGEEVARLGGPGVDQHGAWSPDGAWVVWSSSPSSGASPDLWVARRDGNGAHAITTSPGPDWLPRWLPE